MTNKHESSNKLTIVPSWAPYPVSLARAPLGAQIELLVLLANFIPNPGSCEAKSAVGCGSDPSMVRMDHQKTFRVPRNSCQRSTAQQTKHGELFWGFLGRFVPEKIRQNIQMC